MKVRVISEFKDKRTGKLNKIGDELEMSVERINEVLKVGSFIELIEQTEPTEQKEEPELPDEPEQEEPEPTPEDFEAVDEPTETAPKTTGRRKRS